MPKESKNNNLIISLFPLPEIVLFPGMNLPIHIFEERYKKMISGCLETTKVFGVVLAKGSMCAEIGTTAEIIDVEKLEDGKMNIFTEGKSRFKIVDFISEEPYYIANVQIYEDTESEIDTNLKKTFKEIRKLSSEALNIFDLVSEQELSKKLKLPKEPNELLFSIAANLTCSHESKQAILEDRSIKQRATKVLSLLKEEIQRLEVLLENKRTKNEVVKNGKLKI
ncbi:MAG: LON peptidase substrate-binding domain-containing protein [Candidatus Melainabacteria bacterium]|nr:LON peptidase substrate-binding domain-containing protein [Candidatus Melainabacteria bacterium]